MTSSTHTVNPDGVGGVDVAIDEHGEGRPFLPLHGGGGPQTVTGLGELLAAAYQVQAISPIHPGFAGTPRPEALDSIGALVGL